MYVLPQLKSVLKIRETSSAICGLLSMYTVRETSLKLTGKVKCLFVRTRDGLLLYAGDLTQTLSRPRRYRHAALAHSTLGAHSGAHPNPEQGFTDRWPRRRCMPEHVRPHSRKTDFLCPPQVSPSVQSVQSLSHVRLCNPTDCSTPGFPVLHYLP